MNYNINTVGNFSDDQWVQTLYDQFQQDHQSIAGADQTAAFGLLASEPSRSTDLTHHDVVLNPKGSVSKPSRPRRSRASRRTPATLLNANAANFRALVQQFTGCPSKSISFAASKGPVTLCFDRPTADETTAAKNHDHRHHHQPQKYSYHHHQQHQQEQVHDVLDQRQQTLLHQQCNNTNNNDDDDDDDDGMFSHHPVISNDDLVWWGNPESVETTHDMGNMFPYVS